MAPWDNLIEQNTDEAPLGLSGGGLHSGLDGDSDRPDLFGCRSEDDESPTKSVGI